WFSCMQDWVFNRSQLEEETVFAFIVKRFRVFRAPLHPVSGGRSTFKVVKRFRVFRAPLQQNHNRFLFVLFFRTTLYE
ncbi:hypothetical protein P8A22_38280, partial (plasmid) [Streptomyces laculatispora]